MGKKLTRGGCGKANGDSGRVLVGFGGGRRRHVKLAAIRSGEGWTPFFQALFRQVTQQPQLGTQSNG